MGNTVRFVETTFCQGFSDVLERLVLLEIEALDLGLMSFPVLVIHD